jgi:hypothetical protein
MIPCRNPYDEFKSDPAFAEHVSVPWHAIQGWEIVRAYRQIAKTIMHDAHDSIVAGHL